MKYFSYLFTLLFITMLTTAGLAQQAGPFDNYPVYTGRDLGVRYSPQKTVFKIWAPKASEVKLNTIFIIL